MKYKCQTPILNPTYTEEFNYLIIIKFMIYIYLKINWALHHICSKWINSGSYLGPTRSGLGQYNRDKIKYSDT